MPDSLYMYFNGKFIVEQPREVPGVLNKIFYGCALFETMRALKGRVVFFDWHIERIRSSASLLGFSFDYTASGVQNLIRKIVSLNRYADSRLRLTLWKDKQRTHLSLQAGNYKPYSTAKYRLGFKAAVSPLRQSEGSLLTSIKSSCRLIYQLSLEKAAARGFDESILLNTRGQLCEGSRSNLFFVKDGALFTPALSCGCLAGVTRRGVIFLAKKAGIKVYEGCFGMDALLDADEAFLTNAMIGIMPLAALEKKSLKRSRHGLCSLLTGKYEHLRANSS